MRLRMMRAATLKKPLMPTPILVGKYILDNQFKLLKICRDSFLLLLDSRSERIHKRRRGNGVSAPAVFATSIEKFQQISYQHQLAYDQARNELRRREQAIEIRERDFMEKLLRTADEARERQRQQLVT